jgi:hypothetical protein
MRATDLHRLLLDLGRVRFVDILGAVVMLCVLFFIVAGTVSLLDLLDGRPHEVLPAILAAIAWVSL